MDFYFRTSGKEAQKRLHDVLKTLPLEAASRTVKDACPELFLDLAKVVAAVETERLSLHSTTVLAERLPHAARFYAAQPESFLQALAVLFDDLHHRVMASPSARTLACRTALHAAPHMPPSFVECC